MDCRAPWCTTTLTSAVVSNHDEFDQQELKPKKRPSSALSYELEMQMSTSLGIDTSRTNIDNHIE